MPLENGAERNIRCWCGHIRYCHIGDTGKCLACACSEFRDEKDKTVLTLEGKQGAD